MPRNRQIITAKNIRALISKTGKTQAQIAHEVGIDRKSLRLACKGLTSPKRDTIWKIAQYFRVHPNRISPYDFSLDETVPWSIAPQTSSDVPGDPEEKGTDVGSVPETPGPKIESPITPDPVPDVASAAPMPDAHDAEAQGGFQVLPAQGRGQVRLRMNMELSVDKLSRVLAAVTQ